MRTLLRLLLFLAISAGYTVAGEWHVDETLKCEHCHLQHASEEGQPLPGGPYSVLLLRNSVNDLCLMCHDGSDPTAPDVQGPVTMYQASESGESAGGWFEVLGIENHAGHDLGIEAVTPLRTDGELLNLNCGHCHAVHGNENYRNLHYDPARQGDSILIRDGSDLYTQAKPAIPPTNAGTITAYDRDNVGYRQTYADWCSSCHDQVAINAEGSPPAHFNNHPSDVSLDAYPGDPHADPPHWLSGIGEGFVGMEDGSGIERVPFEAPTATSYATSRTPSTSDEVTCISCHKAHGGAYQKAMRWPHIEGGPQYLAGCQQCHNM